jgi:riboflavin kinase/FMN adenylyltransferase
MQFYEGVEGLRNLPDGVVLSVGNFDGIHRGHRRILDLAGALRGPAGVAVVTFEPHPLTVLRPEFAPPRLTPLPLKMQLLEQAGVDHLAVLPPIPEVLELSAEAFWKILRDDVRPSHIIEGQSFSFGKNRGGNIDRLKEWAGQSNVQLHIVDAVQVPLLDMKIVRASSSLIRWLLLFGRVREAAICLGQPYVMEGIVIKGFQRGRTIGVPTANLDCGQQLLPAEGVYVGGCTVDGTRYPAAVSIGTLPTFDDGKLQFEVHLIGYSGDLYGRTLQVELIDWIREQWKFPGIDALKDRLKIDIEWSKQRNNLNASEPIALLETKG